MMKKDKEPKEKLIIYQVFPRIFTNDNPHCVPEGTLEENGAGKMSQFTPTLLKSLKDLGVNCIWYTGIIEHATKTDFSRYGIEPDNAHVVKGEAGSPYAIKDYYDVDPAIADDPKKRMKEFEALVKRTHAAGLKVIIDFVPNHTARVYHSDSAPKGIKDFGADDDITMGFAPNNNYYYVTNQQFSPALDIDSEPNPYREFPAKATGNDCFSAFCGVNDWYETVKLNYGHDYGNHTDHFEPVPDTWLKMLHILRFWAGKGVDGFRCDMVFMVPLAFWHWAIPQVKADHPHLFFIGEIYDVAQYRSFLDYGCFDYLYDKVNLYDTLRGIETSNVSAAQLTGAWQTVDGIGDCMLNFLENHDEVRFASREYANDPARVVPSLLVSALISKGPFMIYYGQELGECAHDNEGFAGDNNRSTIFDYWSYATMRKWHNSGRCTTEQLNPQERWLRDMYGKVLRMCNERAEIREGKFFDITYANLRNPGFNPHRHYVFFRYTEESALLIAANFANEEAEMELWIPDLAYDMLNLPQGEIEVTDLNDGSIKELHLLRGEKTRIHVEGNNGLVLAIPVCRDKKVATKED